jgi:hypothetical protein
MSNKYKLALGLRTLILINFIVAVSSLTNYNRLNSKLSRLPSFIRLDQKMYYIELSKEVDYIES